MCSPRFCTPVDRGLCVQCVWDHWGEKINWLFDMFWSRVLSIGIISFFLDPVKDLGRQEDRVAGFRSWVRGSGLTAMGRGKWWLDCCKLHCE